MQVVSVLIIKKQHVLVILIKCQTIHAVVVFLVCMFSYLAVKVTNKRSRNSVWLMLLFCWVSHHMAV